MLTGGRSGRTFLWLVELSTKAAFLNPCSLCTNQIGLCCVSASPSQLGGKMLAFLWLKVAKQSKKTKKSNEHNILESI